MRFVSLLVVLLTAAAARADDEASFIPKFDATKIPPPAADKPPPVARVLDQYIYPTHVAVPATGWDDATGDRLSARLLGPIAEEIRKDERFAATEQELNEFAQVMHPEDDAKKLAGSHEIGKAFVRQWKFDRALYRRYGGTVIFQQGNPREPVGAYAAWIKDLTNARIIEVYDDEARQHVWSYFERKHVGVVPPAKVNLEVPWWKLPKE